MVSVGICLECIKLIKKTIRFLSDLIPDASFGVSVNYGILDSSWCLYIDSVISFVRCVGVDEGVVYVDGPYEDLSSSINIGGLYSEWVVDEGDSLDSFEAWERYSKYYPYMYRLLEKYREVAGRRDPFSRMRLRVVLEPIGRFWLSAYRDRDSVLDDEEFLRSVKDGVYLIDKAYREIWRWKATEGMEYYRRTRREAERNIRMKLKMEEGREKREKGGWGGCMLERYWMC